jgi:dual specificity MAP kinase phosphatase
MFNLRADDLEAIEMEYPELVAIDSCGRPTDYKLEFFSQEREEMGRLTTATKISHNVYLGNSADALNSMEYTTPDRRPVSTSFDICIEARDVAEIPSIAALRDAEFSLKGPAFVESGEGRRTWFCRSSTKPLTLEFPSTTPAWMNKHEPERIVSFCEWMYNITHTHDGDAADPSAMVDDTIPEQSYSGLTILLHCQDGYTESTFLALAYLMFAEGIFVHEAWVRLHGQLQRSFFAFESDLQALRYLQSHLISRSPAAKPRKCYPDFTVAPPAWFVSPIFDGSFPSRILPHMYLGNLQHANNPEMLRTLGITRVLSVGEEVGWDIEKEKEAGMQLLCVDNVQDNGIDPLLESIDFCLDFLGIFPLIPIR